MDALDYTVAPGPGSVGLRHRKIRSPEGDLRLAWALFLVLGLPFLLMAALTSLAAARIYVDLLRPFWQPWPPEVFKPFLGIAAFAATLGYLAYRIGRDRGFHSGQLAGLAAARNLAEGWKPPSEHVAVPPTPAPPKDPPPPAEAPAVPAEMPPSP